MIISMVMLFLMLCGAVKGDLRYRGNAVHPDFPGQCFYEELKQPIPKNQSYRPINRDGHCESIFCRSDYVLQIGYCGRHILLPTTTCKIEADMRRAFPDCCPRIVCQQPKGESNYIVSRFEKWVAM
ncbi:uncharacterized protein LOC115630035 [Scaptodrosophila lebanonensis]|uniref:Uncharacterized protein LOC115630035 n=1 Tax=Drosophila lebanonensis TaxID=7225 RepID=A0A6J2U5U7_DROLE|nr:uncharacterized protein LOC115630035 [Scaptodrosophila lebanonensis]